MSEAKLSCCVVRDLLPSYVEELTESETSRLVREHLDSCPECRKVEEEMRAQLGIEHAPTPKLGFLRRYRTRQLVSALLAAIVAITLMCLLYSSEFKYQNTEAGRLAAVEDFVTQENTGVSWEDEMVKIKTGTLLTVHAWAEYDDRLYLFYTADNAERVQGFVELERGINGRYRPLNATCAPSQLTVGADWYRDRKNDVYMLAFYNCRGIYSAKLSFNVYYENSYEIVFKSLDIPSADFLRIMSTADFLKYLGVDPDEPHSMSLRSVKLFDENGNDITAQYTDESVEQNWVGGPSAAETGAVYVFMAIVAILGIILVRFFLKRETKPVEKPKRNIIIGGVIAALGLALLSHVGYMLFTVLDGKPGDVSKAQFVAQLGAEDELTNVTVGRTLTLDFGAPFEHAPTGRTLPQTVTVSDVYILKNTGSEDLSRRLFFPVNYLRSDDERVSITLDGGTVGQWYGVGEQPFIDGGSFSSGVQNGKYYKKALENDSHSGTGFAYYVIDLTLKAGQIAELRLEYLLENACSILVLSGYGAVSCENSRLIINDPNRIKLSSSNKNVTIPEYGGELELSANTDYFTINIG